MVTFPYKKHPSGNFYPVVDFNIYFENSTFYTSALVDSGASISVFTPETAKLLNLTIEKGKEIFLGGVGGRIKGYIHNLQFKIVEKVFTAPVVFSHEYLASYNLLGRNGVFENFKICFDEAGQKVLFEKIWLKNSFVFLPIMEKLPKKEYFVLAAAKKGKRFKLSEIDLFEGIG